MRQCYIHKNKMFIDDLKQLLKRQITASKHLFQCLLYKPMYHMMKEILKKAALLGGFTTAALESLIGDLQMCLQSICFLNALQLLINKVVSNSNLRIRISSVSQTDLRHDVKAQEL